LKDQKKEIEKFINKYILAKKTNNNALKELMDILESIVNNRKYSYYLVLINNKMSGLP
jgi:hypothetical protein